MASHALVIKIIQNFGVYLVVLVNSNLKLLRSSSAQLFS
jgi:hypothetical protein